MSNFPNYFNHVVINFDGQHMKFDTKRTLRFLQIGVFTGDASQYLLEKYSDIGDFVLTDVDTWSTGDSKEMQSLDFEKVEQHYLLRTKRERSQGRCKNIKTSSDYFFANNHEIFQFIYIDGSHESLQIMKDALNAFECLEIGGIIAFDDYLGAMHKAPSDRPKFVLDLFLELMGEKVEVLISNYQLWVRKISKS